MNDTTLATAKMNAPFPSEKLQRFGKLFDEYRRRIAKDQQSQRGWYDDNGVRQGGLIAFVRYFWSVLEPETPFVDGWPLWAMCCPYGTKITTRGGRFPIGELVENKRDCDVLSFNHKTGQLEWKPIVAHMKSPGQTLLRIETSRSGVLHLTDNHPLFIEGRGYVRADQVRSGDRVLVSVLQKGLYRSAERKSVLSPTMLFRSTVGSGASRAYVELQAVWQSILSAAFAPNRRLLFNAMLGGLQDSHEQYNLPAVWSSKDVESRQIMSRVLEKIQEAKGGISHLRLLWERFLSATLADKRAPTPKIRQKLWSILQSKMFWQSIAREKQSFLRQWKPCQSLSAGVLDYSANDNKSGRKSLLYLFDGTKEIGRAPYRSRHHEQRTVEFGRIMSQVPLSAARSFDEGNESLNCGNTCTDFVVAIVRETWIPDAVYNIEILDNNNYFAENILVHNCEHLEAVTFGEINRLLINVPFGFCKSLMTDVYWPAWEWGPIGRAHYRYLAFSYSASLTERDNDRFRTLIASQEYQRLYGPLKTKVQQGEREDGVGLRNKTTINVMNNHTGWKLASSVGGVATGARGDRVICDDPHSVQEAESERVREETVRWFRESISSRFNNLDTGALVIIMQRVHEADVSGIALGPEFDYCHLMIPWEFDPDRQLDEHGQPIPNAIGWYDPRADEESPQGIPAWPERFSETAIQRIKTELGPYATAAQLQQSPMPRGGGLFQRSWWNLWEPDDGRFPIFDYVIASLDGAFTEDEENDPSALTVWGVFTHPETKKSAIMLVHAWRKHLQFSAPRVERLEVDTIIDGKRWLPETIVPGMSEDEVKRRNARFKRRTMSDWGLIEWVQDTCLTFKVDLLLIEAKASGISAAQEISNRYGLQRFGIQLCPVKGDKVARALAVQPTFSQGLVWAPEREWSELMIAEAEVFPKGRYDDLTDSMTQALRYLRDGGMAMTEEEVSHEEYQRAVHKPQRKALYPV